MTILYRNQLACGIEFKQVTQLIGDNEPVESA